MLDNISSCLEISAVLLITITREEFVSKFYVEDTHTKRIYPLYASIRVIYNPNCLASCYLDL